MYRMRAESDRTSLPLLVVVVVVVVVDGWIRMDYKPR